MHWGKDRRMTKEEERKSKKAWWVKGRNFDYEDRQFIADIYEHVDNWKKYCTNCLHEAPVIDGVETETDYCPYCNRYMKGEQ